VYMTDKIDCLNKVDQDSDRHVSCVFNSAQRIMPKGRVNPPAPSSATNSVPMEPSSTPNPHALVEGEAVMDQEEQLDAEGEGYGELLCETSEH